MSKALRLASFGTRVASASLRNVRQISESAPAIILKKSPYQFQYAKRVLQTSMPPVVTEIVTSLCSSVPVKLPPKFVGDIVAQACVSADSEIQFYSSRSCEGTKNLQREIAKYYRAKGLKTDDQKAIFTNSEHNIIAMMIDLLQHEKGSVIMTTPTFGLFFNAFFNREIDVNLVKLSRNDDWKLTPEKLRQTLKDDPQARLFVFINPDNPSGKSYTKTELQALSAEFIEHNKDRAEPLILCCDEASRRIMLNSQEEFCSIATIEGMEKFTLTISTSSKDLAPGLAICHGFGSSWIVDKLLTQKHTQLPDVLKSDRFGPSYPSQVLLEKIFSGMHQTQFDEHLAESIKVYRKNLSIIFESLNELNSTLKTKFGESQRGEYIQIATIPDGGLQCLIEAPALRGMSFPEGFIDPQNPEKITIENSFDLVRYIEQAAQVRLMHGELCGFEGEEMFFRVTISKDNEKMKEVFDRISRSLEQLTPSNENEVDNVVKNASATQVQMVNAEKGLS